MIRLAALALALAAAGCAGDVMGIPCQSDQTCPTGYWCNASGTCTPDDVATPPLLQLDGVKLRSSDPIASRVAVPSSGLSSFTVQIGNYGGSEADYPTVMLDGPACLSFQGDTLASNLIGILHQGDRTDQSVYLDPKACPSSVPVTVHMSIPYGSASSFYVRNFPDGSFTIDLAP
jgi:hypothetical protein